ncbi:MAG: plasmid stabilization protein [Kangiella sp.]|nr:MAG: plasmid stabilization protein [Kangiella sp.]
MTQIVIQKAASFKLDEIYVYSKEKWGKKKAKVYIREMFDSFEKIDGNLVLSRKIPLEFCVDGFYYQYKKHFIYWKYLKKNNIGIVTILHQRMHQLKQFKITN